MDPSARGLYSSTARHNTMAHDNPRRRGSPSSSHLAGGSRPSTPVVLIQPPSTIVQDDHVESPLTLLHPTNPPASSYPNHPGHPSADRHGHTLPRGWTSSSTSNTPKTQTRNRSRTSTISYTTPLPPVMSRENSLEDVRNAEPGPSTLRPDINTDGSSNNNSHPNAKVHGRRSSKSVSNARPSIILTSPTRTKAYHYNTGLAPNTAPVSSLFVSPTQGDHANPRAGLKRRISTPTLVRRQTTTGDEHVRQEGEEHGLGASEAVGNASGGGNGSGVGNGVGRGNAVESRARSTSTSIVVPSNLDVGTPSALDGPASLFPPPSLAYYPSHSPLPPRSLAPIYVTPASPSRGYLPHPRSPAQPSPFQLDVPVSILNLAYNLGESSILKLTRWIRPPHRHPLRRRGSDDSEKGAVELIQGSEEDATTEESGSGGSAARTSEDSLRRGMGRYWLYDDEHDRDDAGHFSIPPSPHSTYGENVEYHNAIRGRNDTLPTPTLSTRSLSRMEKWDGKRGQNDVDGETSNGWLSTLYGVWSGLHSRQRTGKTAEVLRELRWTMGMLVGLFLITATTVIWMIWSMPITRLQHLPKSTTDLQLLSAEIRSYMASSDVGWWHTVSVLTVVGCWKHAWSVPGAVVLNILVGSVLDPIPALTLLTVITATGSLFSYMLSRPFAPLITILFPSKPLALVRAALAPESIPSPPNTASSADPTAEKVTPVHISSDPSTPAIGGAGKGKVWRRLLIMRAMGFVPWSGMNVACGVIGVDWKIFWLTTAAGSASWSYVTASVGNILSRLAIPQSALDQDVATTGTTTSTSASTEMLEHGESLTSLLRDPVLIAKLVFLSALTLLPVIVNRRKGGSGSSDTTPRITAYDRARDGRGGRDGPTDGPTNALGMALDPDTPPMSPSSPLSKSLARFTPTPAVFDLLSFGRTAGRQGGRMVVGGLRSVTGTVKRAVGSVTDGGR